MFSNSTASRAPFLTQLPGFAAMVATAAIGLAYVPNKSVKKEDTTVLSVREPLTSSRQFRVNPEIEVSDVAKKSATKEVQLSEASVFGLFPDWTTFVDVPEVWSSLLSEIEEFSKVQDGWHGVASLALSLETMEQASDFLNKIATNVPRASVPIVGLDSGGYVVFTWNDGELVGSASAYGDGTIAFYFERGGTTLKDGAYDIAAPLPESLRSILVV